MIDQAGIQVSDLEESKAFYEGALTPLGYRKLMEFTAEQTGGSAGVGFGEPPKPDFWIGQGTPNHPPVHLAFRAANRAQVNAFYTAALQAGGRDIEAVCHTPES